MAIKVVEVTIPAQPERIERRQVGIICDLCGADSSERRGRDWGESWSDVEEIEIERTSGYDYDSDARSFTYMTFDICPSCWETKLVPWMASQGATPREKYRDY